MNLHASQLRSTFDTQISVVIEPAEPHATLGALLVGYGLTARELDVARLVLRGDSTRTIAGSCTSLRTLCRTTSRRCSTRSGYAVAVTSSAASWAGQAS